MKEWSHVGARLGLRLQLGSTLQRRRCRTELRRSTREVYIRFPFFAKEVGSI